MIEIKNLTFKYDGGDSDVLHDISITVPEGGFLGVIGPSGAGKTTLLYSINGIIPHHFKGDYYGAVSVLGNDTFHIGLTDISLSVGTVFQDIDSQMVSSVVEDEILYGLENFGVPKEEIERRISETLTEIGIEHLRYRDISTLSGGQKQKVAIAAILALRPKVLLLDEPTGELDPVASCQIFESLKKLNEEQGVTIVVVEQKIMLLSEFAKSLAVIDGGRLAFHGPVREVLKNASEMEAMGVNCPRVVTLSNALTAKGLSSGKVCLSIDEAEQLVREVLE